MKRTKPCLMLAMLLAGGTVYGKTVGLWNVAPRYVTDAMTKMIEKAGWRVVTVGNRDLDEGAVLADLDVLFLPGAWDAYRLAGFRVRRNLVKFVADGKGILDCYVRTSHRPLFPQVGTTFQFVNAQLIAAHGKSELATTISEPFSLGDAFHLLVKAGPEGRLFAVSGENPVGVHGEAYGGRYVLFGSAFSRMGVERKTLPAGTAKQLFTMGAEDKDLPEGKAQQPLSMDVGDKATLGGTPQQLLLACLDWLASAPEFAAADRGRQQTQADLDFLRREKLCDWTQTKSVEDGNLSVVPEIRSRLAIPLEKRLYTVRQLGKSLTGQSLDRCRALADELQQTIGRLDSSCQKVLSEVDDRIGKMESSALMEDNPFVDAAGVLKRIEAAPGKTEAEKAEIIALVKRCSSESPPLDAPWSVALYLHGQAIAEQMMPGDRLSELTNLRDKAILELQSATQAPAPSTPATVEERLHADPLMAPYYTGSILPTPQKADYRDEFIPMANAAIVVGKDVENPDPLVEVLTDRITRYGGQAAVVNAPTAEHTAVVSLGNTDISQQAKDLPAVPEREQGYILHITKAADKPLVVLKGHDRLGLLWSIASLMQLIHWRDGQTMARAATVVDYPIMQRRGLILSGEDIFHPATDRNGRILSYPNTDLVLQQNRLLMLVCKVNEPCYQQFIFADCYSHYWKHPDKMPPDAHIEEDLAAMGRNLTPLGITWWAGIRPHAAGDSSPEELSRKLCADEESVQGLLYFARKTEEAGGHLAIILDDIRFPIHPYDQEHLGTAREVDTWLVTNVMARLKKDHPKARLLVCPPFYWGPLGRGWMTYGEDREEYLRKIGETWPPEIEVFWTGRQVNAATLAIKEYYDWWMGLTKRKPYFWQNCVAYWCHLARRHYPTDSIDSLWQCYWEGQFDYLGWYGFNGGDIPRYSVTDAISADFQWNPQAYGKEQQTSALRSVREAAEKFIGQGSWTMLCNVTQPLSAFDEFYTEARETDVRRAVDQAAAKVYDRLETKRNETMVALKALKERYPMGLKHWSALEGFAGWANDVDRIKADPGLRLYRAAVEQREKARKAGDFDPGRDVFFAAADFVGGRLTEVPSDEWDEETLEPAATLDGVLRSATADFSLTQDRAAGAYELWVCARKNETAERLALTLNGKTFFDAKVPFGELETTVARFPVPAKLLTEKKNTLALNFTADALKMDLGVKDSEPAPGAPPLAIRYAVLKCNAVSKK
ncbi:MAG: beta-N-acetylglucosaminidase domain-containing protein [Planctomycetes bacterium]|nr:beta-N-acetylglucosaminidase domain-containing protein [Planctomycetota bacterium]